LALYQTELVKTRLEEDFPLVEIEIVKIKTGGDMIRRAGHHPFETKRIYTHEIEDALLAGDIDLAVHSAKDMAAVLPEGLEIGGVLAREDSRDCLLSNDKKPFSALPLGARIGTSSLRRKMQLLRWNPELIVEDVHGNVDTRIHKMQEGEFDALVLAHAGIIRLGFTNYVTEIFSEEQFYPAPGQGIIAIESRTGDPDTKELLAPISHAVTMRRLECERAFLKRLEGGCQLPCGIRTHVEDGRLKTSGAIFAVEGHEMAESRHEGEIDHAAILGNELAQKVLDNGGREILTKIRHAEQKKKE